MIKINIELRNRTEENVKIFWEQSQRDDLNEFFPFQKMSLQEAINQYEDSLKENSASYGQVICVDGKYIGDVWIYMIDNEEKSCFLSIVVFDEEYHSKGIGTASIMKFIDIVKEKYALERILAFTYVSNKQSQNLLSRAGFEIIERFEEDGVESFLYMYEIH